MSNLIKIILRNPLQVKVQEGYSDFLEYTIMPLDTPIKEAWLEKLRDILRQNLPIDNDFCHLGFPQTHRDLPFLCNRLNDCKRIINEFPWEDFVLRPIEITETFTPELCVLDESVHTGITGGANDWVNHDVMNNLHNYFEKMNGTIENPSPYIAAAQKWPEIIIDDVVHYPKNVDQNTPCAQAIKDLNLICHEMESLINAQKAGLDATSTTIVQWNRSDRWPLEDYMRDGFVENRYKRIPGGVYLHWSQVGKTLLEVFNDEGAPKLDKTTCEAITHLDYYSAMFDIHWGPEQDWAPDTFWPWLEENGFDPNDKYLSLGFIPIGQVNLEGSFGTVDPKKILAIKGRYLHIHSIEFEGIKAVYE